VLLNQPFGAWTGTPASSLTLVGAQAFPAWSSQPILLQDATGLGVATTGSSPGNSDNLTIGTLPDPPPTLQPPFLVLPNLLPVTCGKTVTNEVLGSGDATNPAQDFQLSQSPVTYLSQGAGYASTIALTVNTMPWTEVASFYDQLPTATVFATREDNNGKTHVMFGDGVNGARLPTGVNNVVATYRVGAGAASPSPGKLTLIAKSYPGLRSVLNPVAVSGGSDADQANEIQRDAPRSVLTFGRAVSVFDYEALAAEAPGVTRASAVWAWNDARQRTLVTVYVGDDSGAATSARQALAAAGDPNRPVLVVQATQIAVALIITLLMTPGMDPGIVSADVIAALTDNKVGLFGSWNMSIGQTVFDSQIEAAVLSVQGAVAITAQSFIANGATGPGPLHIPGEGAYYTLDPADIDLTLGPDPHG
jgi:predicted phage baseplate assembly protein